MPAPLILIGNSAFYLFTVATGINELMAGFPVIS